MSTKPSSFIRGGLFAAALALVSLAGTPARAAENPMAFVGQQHNIFLDCIIDNEPQFPFDPFYILIDICLFNTGMSSKEFSATYTPLMPADLLAPMNEMLAPHRKQFTDTQYAYISEIENILATQSPEEAAKSLEALEAKAVAKLGRKSADLAVLGGLSTARSSLYYWTVENPWEQGGEPSS